MKNILPGKKFDNPKPISLLDYLIEVSTRKDSIVLDSFAGSGTTAHAVLNANKRDGGTRRFILVELMDYVETITAERVKKVIDGYNVDETEVVYNKEITIRNIENGAVLLDEAYSAYNEAKKKYKEVKKPFLEEGHLIVEAVNKDSVTIEGTGGDFTFYDLGQALLLPDGNLNEEVETEKIREYVWYMETKMPLIETTNENPYYLGTSKNTGYYFFYEKDRITTLGYEFLATIKEKSEGYLIYADLCTIPDDELKRHNIAFKKIPRDIAKL